MANFILTGEHCDDAMEAKRAHQSGQQQWAEADGLVDQSESGERDLSLTLLQREYSYNCLKSWWQNMEQQINQCASGERQMPDSHNGVANYESTPKEGGSEQQENQLEDHVGVVRDAEECVQTAEPALEGPTHSGRRSMQAIPEALFLAEKLRQLADTTREMAQHLLSPQAARSRGVATAGSEAMDSESCAGTSDVELMQQKILLLDDVVAELSQYRLSLDMTERLIGEPSQSQCLRNESAGTCNSAISESTNCEGENFPQELDSSNSTSSLAEDVQNTTPCVVEGASTWSSGVPIADKELLNAGFRTQDGSENADPSSSTLVEDPQSPHFPADVTKDETISSHIQLPHKELQLDSRISHLESHTSDFSSQERRFSTCHGKEAADTAQRIRRGGSELGRLDRVTATVQRLLRYPILRHVLNAKETNTAGSDTLVGQTISRQLVQSDVAASVTEPPQQEPQTNTSSSHLDISNSNLSQEVRFSTCQENERPCQTGGTAYQGQQGTTQPCSIDGMIALIQRLLRLQIMGHVPTPQKTNTNGDDAVEAHAMPWQFVQSDLGTAAIASSQQNISRLVQI